MRNWGFRLLGAGIAVAGATTQSLQSLSPTLQAQFDDVAFALAQSPQRRFRGCRRAMNEQQGTRLMLVFGLVLAITVGSALVIASRHSDDAAGSSECR